MPPLSMQILCNFNGNIVLSGTGLWFPLIMTLINPYHCCCCCSVSQSCPSFVTPWTATHQAFLSFTISQSLLKLMSIESVMPSNHPSIRSSVILFSSCLQSFPTSGSFPMTQSFTSGGQSIGASASASVLPMNIQDLFPLRLIGVISLQSTGLSRFFSSTIQKHQFFGTQTYLWSNSHICT